MKNFIREHETTAEEALKRGGELRVFRAYHERQIGYLQAERLAHLLVMLAVAVFSVGALLALLLRPSIETAALLGLLLALLVPYLFHYFRLENATQRWYRIARRLDRSIGRLPEGSPPGTWG